MNRQTAVDVPKVDSSAAAANGVLQRKCGCGRHSYGAGECSACRKNRVTGLHRAAVSATRIPAVLPIVHEVLRTPGKPLDAATREFMEPRFGHDFSRVRVHTDAQAAESAQDVDARAYAVGQHIVFGAEQYQPATREGLKLLAHELAHTLQQRAGGERIPDHLEIAKATVAAEREAEEAAKTIGQGQAVNSELPAQPQAVQVARTNGDQEIEIEGLTNDCVCGPDVTAQTINAIKKTKSEFAGWVNDIKDSHCSALFSQSTAGIAWDIDELHNQQWIKRYRPECATKCGNQPCGKFYPDEVGSVAAATGSVWIQDGCYYPGSVNYVIYGVMCKLCFDFYVSISDSDYSHFTEKAMQTSIWNYKGGGLTLSGPSANFHPSQHWAKAGYHGWPSAGTPGPDRPKCTRCPISYLDGRSRTPVSKSGTFARIATGEFSVHWVPEWHVGILGWTPFADPKKEGWIGGPDKDWKPPSPP